MYITVVVLTLVNGTIHGCQSHSKWRSATAADRRFLREVERLHKETPNEERGRQIHSTNIYSAKQLERTQEKMDKTHERNGPKQLYTVYQLKKEVL